MNRLITRRFWFTSVSLSLLAVSLAVLAAGSGRREDRNFAFLVGVEEYDKTELKPALFAVNDIVEFRQVLIESGFKENRIVMLNEKQPRRFLPEGQKIRGKLRLLLDGLEEDDTIVVALAGHGIQFEGDKDNYFCPIDAKLDDKKTLISLKEIYDQLEGSAAGRKLLLVDACRNDPQSQLGRATRPSVKLNSVTRPQTEPVPEGIVAVFSCRAGQQSFGDPDLKHGIFFQHVRITKPFYMGIHEVTVDQFRQFVNAEKYKTEPERDGQGGGGYNAAKNNFEGPKPQYTWQNTGWSQSEDHPVVNVTWNDAEAFCDWLSRKDGRKYRLPTEAEWEYACPAGTTTRWYNGDDAERLPEVGNVADGTAKEKHLYFMWAVDARDGYVFTAPVGKFKPNAFGLYDMHGNAWECCSDYYDLKYYEQRVEVDPQGPATGDKDNHRVMRGGSWSSSPWNSCSADRNRHTPDYRYTNIGFRVVCSSLP